jgi:hypothetical protein
LLPFQATAPTEPSLNSLFLAGSSIAFSERAFSSSSENGNHYLAGTGCPERSCGFTGRTSRREYIIH